MRIPLRLTWFKMGMPAKGRVAVTTPGTFSFEEGAEVPRRLEGVFGDLTRLTAADLGCGPAETVVAGQVFNAPWGKLLSVEAFLPYIHRLQEKTSGAKQHEIINSRIEEIIDEIPPGEVDVALLIDVLEHFKPADAMRLLLRLEQWVGLGIVVFLPLGNVPQGAYDHNALQRHLSSWKAGDLARLGYDVTVYPKFHGQLDPAADAAWAFKLIRGRKPAPIMRHAANAEDSM